MKLISLPKILDVTQPMHIIPSELISLAKTIIYHILCQSQTFELIQVNQKKYSNLIILHFLIIKFSINNVGIGRNK